MATRRRSARSRLHAFRRRTGLVSQDRRRRAARRHRRRGAGHPRASRRLTLRAGATRPLQQFAKTRPPAPCAGGLVCKGPCQSPGPLSPLQPRSSTRWCDAPQLPKGRFVLAQTTLDEATFLSRQIRCQDLLVLQNTGAESVTLQAFARDGHRCAHLEFLKKCKADSAGKDTCPLGQYGQRIGSRCARDRAARDESRRTMAGSALRPGRDLS